LKNYFRLRDFFFLAACAFFRAARLALVNTYAISFSTSQQNLGLSVSDGFTETHKPHVLRLRLLERFLAGIGKRPLFLCHITPEN